MGKVNLQKLRRRRHSTAAATTTVTSDIGDEASSVTALNTKRSSSSKKKKSVKMRDKHEKFMHKIRMSSGTSQLPSSSSSSSRRPLKRRGGGVKNLLKKSVLKKRSRGGIVGGIRTLLDALPDLNPVLSASIATGSSASRRDRRSAATTGSTKQMPKRPLSKFKTSQKNMMKDIAVFRQVLKHPEYLVDPTGTIASHLRKTIGIID